MLTFLICFHDFEATLVWNTRFITIELMGLYTLKMIIDYVCVLKSKISLFKRIFDNNQFLYEEIP